MAELYAGPTTRNHTTELGDQSPRSPAPQCSGKIHKGEGSCCLSRSSLDRDGGTNNRVGAVWLGVRGLIRCQLVARVALQYVRLYQIPRLVHTGATSSGVSYVLTQESPMW